MRPKLQTTSIFAGALLALLIILLTNGSFSTLTTPIISNDIDQHRINTALPILNDGLTVEQTFVAGHDGLTAVSVTLAKFDNIIQNENSSLTIVLLDEVGTLLAIQSIQTENVAHNFVLHLRFDPVPNSYNQTYTIQISGDNNTAFSVWGYDLDVYEAGGVSLSDALMITAVQDIRFSTQYQLTFREAGRTLF